MSKFRGAAAVRKRTSVGRITGSLFAVTLILMLAFLPWLETWERSDRGPHNVYRGLQLLQRPEIQFPPWGLQEQPFLNQAAPALIVGYLLLAVACALFPATIVAVSCSVAGSAVTVALLMATNHILSDYPRTGPGAEWMLAPKIALALWLVIAALATVQWSAKPPHTIGKAA